MIFMLLRSLCLMMSQVVWQENLDIQVALLAEEFELTV